MGRQGLRDQVAVLHEDVRPHRRVRSGDAGHLAQRRPGEAERLLAAGGDRRMRRLAIAWGRWLVSASRRSWSPASSRTTRGAERRHELLDELEPCRLGRRQRGEQPGRGVEEIGGGARRAAGGRRRSGGRARTARPRSPATPRFVEPTSVTVASGETAASTSRVVASSEPTGTATTTSRLRRPRLRATRTPCRRRRRPASCSVDSSTSHPDARDARSARRERDRRPEQAGTDHGERASARERCARRAAS